MLSVILRHGFREIKPAVSLTQRRNFLFRVKTSEKKYRLKDKVDEGFSMIYKAPMEYIIATCNVATCLSATAIITYGCYVYNTRFEVASDDKEALEFLGAAYSFANDEELMYFAICLIGTCVAVKSILYKYPLRIYKNQANKYIAIFEGNIPFMRNKFNFQSGDVKEMPKTGLLPWKDHRYSMNNRSIIMYYEYFKTPAELDRMIKVPKKSK